MANDPDVTPVIWLMKGWKCWRCPKSMLHEYALAGRTPSSGSLAEPENEIVSPACHVCVATGAEIEAEGPRLPTLMTKSEETDDSPVPSARSETVRRAV